MNRSESPTNYLLVGRTIESTILLTLRQQIISQHNKIHQKQLNKKKQQQKTMSPPLHYSEAEAAEIGKRAWKTASRAAKHMSKHSKIVNPSMEKCIPRFERDEIVLGEVLGSGGFNDVHEVKRITLVEQLSDAEHAKKISSPLQTEHRLFVSKHVFRESSQNCRYAIKFLSQETIEDANRYCTGAADLVIVRTSMYRKIWTN